MKDSRQFERESYSRRRFLRATPATIAALSAAPALGSAPDLLAASLPNGAADEHFDYYDKLGVTKLINAAGTYTELTSAVMPPPVRATVISLVTPSLS